MKFLVIDFDVIERGGINRIAEGLKYGLESAGCVFDYYWASRGGRLTSLSPDRPTMVNDRYYRLPAGQIHYGKKNSVDEYEKLLKKYDVVMFMLPCPHDIKGKQGDMSWTMLYETASSMGKPIISIIHDNLWDKYYEWYRQVSDMVKFHLFTCYQSKYDSLSRLPGNFVFLPTPLDVRQAALYQTDKSASLCWMPQWKKWKGIYQFLQAMPDIHFPIDLYNSGIEYHNARQDESGIWKRAIGLNHVNKTKGLGDPTHQYWGSQLPGEIPGIYKSHSASLDLSGSIGERFDGQTSCVMLEAMVYGCVSVVHEKVASHPWSPLSGKDVAWTVPSDPSGIAERINELLGNPKRGARLAARALDFVTSYGDARTAAYQILDYLSLFRAGELAQQTRPVFWGDTICTDEPPQHDPEVYEKHEYVSKNAPKAAVLADETDIAEDVQEGVEEVADEAADIASIVQGSPALRTISGALENVQGDARILRLITKMARAWVEVYGDLYG